MMDMMKAAAGLGAVAFVGLVAASCATLNEDECRSVDWTGLGQSDGAAGRPQSYLDRHREACVKHGLDVDQTAWLSGWSEGIVRYCTPQNGLSEGLAGHGYARSCPAELSSGFETAYHIGKRLKDARTQRETLERELDTLLTELDEAEDREARRNVREEISAKRQELRHARDRERDAERVYDVYLLSDGLRS